MDTETETPKVSIIMTTFNAEKHIKESIDSALSQTLREIEIVCIDGHSTDSTCQIIEEYSKSDGRVRLLFQDRPTIGAAKNCGIEWSRGEYFTFLDADDFYVDNNALAEMYAAAKRTGCPIVGALRSTVYESDGRIYNELLHRADCKNHPEGVKLKFLDRQYDYHFHSYIYDRNVILNSDARFAEVSAYDDTHFFIRAMLLAGEFYVIPVELYRYRCGPPYVFSQKQANDAIGTLTDQLILTKSNHLARLHWTTVQRINWEYGDTLESNIRKGDIYLLEKLINANREIDSELIDKALSEEFSIDYLDPMLHRNLCDLELRLNPNNTPKYILEPLYRLLTEKAVEPPHKPSLIIRGKNYLEKRKKSRT